MNGNGYLLDSNVVIDLLSGDPAAKQFHDARLVGAHLAVSQLTRIEVLGYHGISAVADTSARAFFSRVSVFPLDNEVENKAIILRRQLRMRLADAVILATALSYGHVLVSRDAGMIQKADGIVSCVSLVP